jgi:hypothetical protein
MSMGTPHSHRRYEKGIRHCMASRPSWVSPSATSRSPITRGLKPRASAIATLPPLPSTSTTVPDSRGECGACTSTTQVYRFRRALEFNPLLDDEDRWLDLLFSRSAFLTFPAGA